MENNYKWNKIDKMPSNDKPLLILDRKNKLHILYKEWEERDSFEKWFKLCSEEDIKKWCYFEIGGFITNPEDCKSIMEYSFEGTKDIYKENQRLKAQLDREIKINRKMKSALEKYADVKNWDSYGNDWMFGVYKFENDDYPEYTDNKLAQQVLKEIDNKE